MKISVKLQEQQQQSPRQPPLLVRAKIPVSVFTLPLLSHFSTTTAHPSDLSLSLSTNFPSGPSLKLSYATATSTSTSAADTPPLSLTLKSGTGLFGSPVNSPLVISARFSFNPSNPNCANPTFSLLFKPRLGSFSLRKSAFSHAESSVRTEHANGDAGGDSTSFGFVPVERPASVKQVLVEKNDKASIFRGIQLAARTQIPVAKRAALNLRWWVNFAEDQMPVLKISKIGLHRVNDIVNNDDKEKKKDEGRGGELEVEVLKGMCSSMKRELDALARVNREMKGELEELKAGRLVQNSGGEFREGLRKKAMPCAEGPSGFEQWRSKRTGGGEKSGNMNGKKEEKNDSVAIDVENELQRAIKAAAASP